jgi:hypothetical protein
MEKNNANLWNRKTVTGDRTEKSGEGNTKSDRQNPENWTGKGSPRPERESEKTNANGTESVDQKLKNPKQDSS